ncbi:tumor necrosis factor receptor superfamily member 1A [Cololabis saira]|uniref:tumor necrosis factor receptor superfamily member 1A n=1 Tax=Cololabis saira TaxID=129043 RepID=UPI002AD40413|nr:tumor necrosis factor receptor superfamily member 1A [Cololabis saira]
MDFVWVVVLVFAPMSSGQSCFSICPSGYYKTGDCEDPSRNHSCKECAKGTFTDIENKYPRCMRCKDCSMQEEKVQNCSTTRNTVCDCPKGYYYLEHVCVSCSIRIKDKRHDDYKKKCLLCQHESCMNDPECKRKCTSTTPSPSTKPSTVTAKTTATTETSASASKSTPEASNKTQNPVAILLQSNKNNPMVWIYVVFVVLSLVVLLLLLHFSKNLLRQIFACWSSDEDVEMLAENKNFNEKNLYMNTLTISEESPMMSLCQEPPTHISPCLPDSEHIASQQDKESDRWPAIVLYAIIKEVPLRRWKEFLRLLSVSDQEMERVELEACLGSKEKQYQMLRLWSQHSSASLNDVYSSLHYMDLSGCAQQLQESLENLEWRPGGNQVVGP